MDQVRTWDPSKYVTVWWFTYSLAFIMTIGVAKNSRCHGFLSQLKHFRSLTNRKMYWFLYDIFNNHSSLISLTIFLCHLYGVKSSKILYHSKVIIMNRMLMT